MKTRVRVMMVDGETVAQIECFGLSATAVATWQPNSVHPQKVPSLGIKWSGRGLSMCVDSIPRTSLLARALLRWKPYKRNVSIEFADYSDTEELPW